MTDQKYCRNCGTPNLPDAKFCANCGEAFSAQSSQHLSPQEAPYLEDEILNRIRGLLLPVTGKKILVGGVLLIFLIFLAAGVSAMVSPPNSGGGAGTVTPTLVPTVAPTAKATVKTTPTSKPTAAPTASPPSSPEKLTQAQLDAFEASLVAKGYSFPEHLHYDHTDSDGNLVYKAKTITAEGYNQNVELTVYKDQSSADAALTKDVSILEVMGFSGSYNDANSWTGVMMYQGTAVGGGAVESSDGAPYMVTVFFMG